MHTKYNISTHLFSMPFIFNYLIWGGMDTANT